MQIPTEKEFKESIRELSDYKNRLEKEVTTISEKLKTAGKSLKKVSILLLSEFMKLSIPWTSNPFFKTS